MTRTALASLALAVATATAGAAFATFLVATRAMEILTPKGMPQ